MSAVDATLGERLEAAAISWLMIAAEDPAPASFVPAIALRFGVDEQVLLRAARSRATRRTYDRILSPPTRVPADASSA